MSWNRLQAQTMVLVRNMLWALFPWLRRVQSGQFLHSDSTMLVDLMSQAREIPEVVQHELGSAASSDNGVTSSSRSDSEPDLESPKVCKPPEAVVGAVMVQHKKWRTVHLVPEGFKKFLERLTRPSAGSLS